MQQETGVPKPVGMKVSAIRLACFGAAVTAVRGFVSTFRIPTRPGLQRLHVPSRALHARERSWASTASGPLGMKKGARNLQIDVGEDRAPKVGRHSLSVGKLGGLQKVALLAVAGAATSQLLPHAAMAAAETAVPIVSAAADGTLVEKLTSSGFFQAFSLVFVSEIGDKTFFIAALLAAKTSRLISFAGSVGALAVMTVLAVLLGLAFHSVPSVFTSGLPVDDIIAAAAFLYFGINTLKDAYQLPDDSNEGIDEERAEAEESVKELEGKKTVW